MSARKRMETSSSSVTTPRVLAGPFGVCKRTPTPRMRGGSTRKAARRRSAPAGLGSGGASLEAAWRHWPRAASASRGTAAPRGGRGRQRRDRGAGAIDTTKARRRPRQALPTMMELGLNMEAVLFDVSVGFPGPDAGALAAEQPTILIDGELIALTERGCLGQGEGGRERGHAFAEDGDLLTLGQGFARGGAHGRHDMLRQARRRSWHGLPRAQGFDRSEGMGSGRRGGFGGRGVRRENTLPAAWGVMRW